MLTKFIKISVLFFMFFIMFFFVPCAYAKEWIKYSQNPVLTPTTNWDSQVSSPAIIFDENKFKMWYQGHGNGYWSIGYAESTDGINWQRTLTVPVLTPQNEDNLVETGLVEPTVIKNDQYRMWFNSQNNTIYNIRYAFSSDGINWTKYQSYVLKGESSWESQGVANPSVIFKDGKYFMWYMGWGSGGWKIGLAESIDGIVWTKNQNNPLNLPNLGHVGGPSVAFIDGKFHMAYHTGGTIPANIYHVTSDDGINWSCDGECSILSTSSGFDSNMIVYPEIIKNDSDLYLYYTGYDGNLWQIGLASETPISQTKMPIVIVPGLFASWNKQAIVYNQPVNINDWQLNPFVHEYDGIKQTLINLGYQENQDFYISSYDWRKDLNSLADDLNSYLNQVQASRFNLVGHSLGGLVARIYTQKYGSEKINKIITVGSPHQGVAQAYKAVEAGEIDRYDNFFWLAQKLILQLNKNGIKTDKQVIEEKFPIAKDLLPTYNFLKKNNNEEVSISDMKIKNDFLLSSNPNLPNIPNLPNLLQTIVGEAGETLAGFKVGQRTTLDRLLDYYPDGRPTENFSQIGDYLVLSSSAQTGNNNKIFSLGHSELIYKKEPIKEILNSFALPYQENQISEGAGTTISPSLIFLILSPATMEVEFNNNTYIEKDGLIFIKNAESGDYRLKVTGKEKGSYKIIIWEIGDADDLWTTLSGEITADPPASQTDIYTISFDPRNLLDFPVNQNDLLSLFDLLKLKLDLLKKEYNHSDLGEAAEELRDAKKNFLKRNYKQMRKQLIEAQNEIFSVRKKAPPIYKNALYESLSQLENLYELTAKMANYSPKLKNLDKKYVTLSKKIAALENYLLQQMEKNKKITEKTQSLLLMKEKLLKENELKTKKRLAYWEIVLLSASRLSEEIK